MPIPAPVKPTVAQLLSLGASLERGWQTAINTHGQRDTSIEDALLESNLLRWAEKLAGFTGELRRAGAPNRSSALMVMMVTVFEPMARRIANLRHKAISQRR
ncbi:hypothetical protein GN109_25230 [Collimonas pratensis]|uniref:hypothetical protein n=1 Tax=Collimonas pratensis TaxID=279113 RepID=UPI00143D5438|nr:hypothetical protein [Collimonas pratensis]NKI72727.1 hypothetical protein [Collimonas pratensis]